MEMGGRQFIAASTTASYIVSRLCGGIVEIVRGKNFFPLGRSYQGGSSPGLFLCGVLNLFRQKSGDAVYQVSS